MFHEDQSKGLSKLRLIVAEKYKPQMEESSEDHLSPPSADAKFQIEDTPNELMQKIVEFDSKAFFKETLRKRTNFFGMEKDEDDILVIKNKPLSKSLTKLEAEDEKDAIKIFKQILKVAEEPKLEQVFQQVQRILFLCRKASEELINEVLLQLIKQSNTTNEATSIRTIQALIVFLHVYDPDPDFIVAALNFIFKKIADNSYTERQTDYFKYAYRKMLRKLQTRAEIGFMPIKYQIMALMCKRIISIPIHLPVGSGTHVKVESFETLQDIKQRAMEEFGINTKRLSPDLFSFFEVTNFPIGTSEERPLPEKINVWDLVSYWNRSAVKYSEENEHPPSFFLVLKIRFVYECYEEDDESVQLMFGQTYFDYFMGRLRVSLKPLANIAACVKKIQYENDPEEWKKCYPEWAYQKFSQEQLEKEINESYRKICQLIQQTQPAKENLYLKFTFLKFCEEAPLTLALSIATEQRVKLHFRHKTMYLSDEHEIVEEIPIKNIVKYADKDNEFIFSVRNSSQAKIIYTEHGAICVKYMSTLRDLIVGKSKTVSGS